MRENKKNRPLTIRTIQILLFERSFSKSLKPFFPDLVAYIFQSPLFHSKTRRKSLRVSADVSHYREIKKNKSANGRSKYSLAARGERDPFANVGVQKTHNRHEHKVRHTTVFNVSVSWETAGAERILYRAN